MICVFFFCVCGLSLGELEAELEISGQCLLQRSSEAFPSFDLQKHSLHQVRGLQEEAQSAPKATKVRVEATDSENSRQADDNRQERDGEAATARGLEMRLAALEQRAETAEATVQRADSTQRLAVEASQQHHVMGRTAQPHSSLALQAVLDEAARQPNGPVKMHKTEMYQDTLPQGSKHAHGETWTSDWQGEYPPFDKSPAIAPPPKQTWVPPVAPIPTPQGSHGPWFALIGLLLLVLAICCVICFASGSRTKQERPVHMHHEDHHAPHVHIPVHDEVRYFATPPHPPNITHPLPPVQTIPPHQERQWNFQTIRTMLMPAPVTAAPVVEAHEVEYRHEVPFQTAVPVYNIDAMPVQTAVPVQSLTVVPVQESYQPPSYQQPLHANELYVQPVHETYQQPIYEKM